MRLTHASFAVASVLMSDPDREWYGFEVRQAADVASGVLYPLLDRMRAVGWLDDRWEEELDPRAVRGPRRRYLRVTPVGRAALAAMLEQASRDRRFI